VHDEKKRTRQKGYDFGDRYFYFSQFFGRYNDFQKGTMKKRREEKRKKRNEI
jgi:hypothetical protein|tara:strand:+ start:770 stop:925 length:156 start_codon:yes stop_codon:yes gene_type:complete